MHDISVMQFSYLMLTNTVMPEESAWNLPLKTTERTGDVAFIQHVIRSMCKFPCVKKKYIEIFFIYNVRACGLNACPKRLILWKCTKKRFNAQLHITIVDRI